MRRTNILLFTIIISANVFAQEQKRIFKKEFAIFSIQCEHIGKTIIDKNVTTDFENWYEGQEKEKGLAAIQQLENDINQSHLEVTYHLVLLNENPLIYTYNFYNEKTKSEFGQLFIKFTNRDNILVDDIKFTSKAKMEEIYAKNKGDATYEGAIPPPPPPPPLPKTSNKKDTGNR